MEDILSHTMAHASFKLHIETIQCLVRFIGLPTCRALKLVALNYAMNIGPTAERDTYTTAAVPTYTTRPKGDETAK